MSGLINETRGAANRFAIADVITAACEVTGVERDDLLSPNREHYVVNARHYAIALAHRLTGRTLPVLGREFGRDHSAVLYALRRVARMQADADVALILARIERRALERAQSSRRLAS